MIFINDQSFPLEQTKSLTDLFNSLNIDVAKGVAIAVNNKVIARTDWSAQVVKPNDKVLMIKATQGG